MLDFFHALIKRAALIPLLQITFLAGLMISAFASSQADGFTVFPGEEPDAGQIQIVIPEGVWI